MKTKQIALEGLTIQETINLLNTLKKGIYHSFTRKHTESNGYYFIRTYVGRLGSYAKVVGKEETTNTISKNRITIIPNVLYYNENTQNYLLMVLTTKCKNHHSKTHYYDNNGNEIDKDTYEMVNPQKKNSFDSPVFNIKLQELVMVK